MPNGYCAPILDHIEAISCAPSRKLMPVGFLSAVLSQMDTSVSQVVNQQNQSGHTRSISVAYRQKPLKSQTRTAASCENAVMLPKKEFTFPDLLYRDYQFHIPLDTIRQYCTDASQKVKIIGTGDNRTAQMDGSGGTWVMQEVYDQLIDGAGVLLEAINDDIVTLAATQFGKNRTTGDALAKHLEFSLNSNAVTDAYFQLLKDLRANKMNCTMPIMVGNGDLANLATANQNIWANAAADNGINKAQLMSFFNKMFYDDATASLWGENQIGIFEPGSLALITFMEYVGSFAGRLATSDRTTIAFPVEQFCCPDAYLDRLMFDLSIKEYDCPTAGTINGVSTTIQPGVIVTLSKHYTLFSKPTDMYQVGDPLYGTNGRLRYEIVGAN